MGGWVVALICCNNIDQLIYSSAYRLCFFFLCIPFEITRIAIVFDSAIHPSIHSFIDYALSTFLISHLPFIHICGFFFVCVYVCVCAKVIKRAGSIVV